MNCKPGDLAVIVRCRPQTSQFIGRVLRVISPVVSAGGYDAWYYEGPRLTHEGEVAECIEDCLLRPIRDPGDDARDETLQWLPVPQQERTEA